MNIDLDIALVGNPNCGKSSLFNALTGLHQKVANFPGVTVEKKVGKCVVRPDLCARVTDLPGMYSLYPKRSDEWVVYDCLFADKPPDMLLLTVDASNIKRNLLFCSQVMDLHIPVIIVLTMVDVARTKQIHVDLNAFERQMGVPVVSVHPRRSRGIDALKKLIARVWAQKTVLVKNRAQFVDHEQYAGEYINAIRPFFPDHTQSYRLIHHAIFSERMSDALREPVRKRLAEKGFNPSTVQAQEIVRRYERISAICQQCIHETNTLTRKFRTEKIDNIVLHRYWGYVILVLSFFVVFQSIFWLASYPMDWIEAGCLRLEQWVSAALPDYLFIPVLTNTFVAKLLFSGISATVVFVPQVMILSGMITFLEDSGYMARVSFLSDSLMRKFGLNGKSVMPLISGMACAVPAILAARSIENRKERLLTIFVLPFVTCSARLPIFLMLTSLTVPQIYYFHWISLQGLVMTGLYLCGFATSFVLAWVGRFFIHTKERSIFILELPLYKKPLLKTIVLDMLQKAKIFVVDVGKVIVLVSAVLTVLFSFVPTKQADVILQAYEADMRADPAHKDVHEKKRDAAIMRASYAAQMGRLAEPLVQPIGYNWQIGVAVLSSFAAREVFLGTLATVYSFDGDESDDDQFLRHRLAELTRPDGTKIFSLATSFSLLVFYMLAMQCMSTVAVVRRETKSLGFVVVQFAVMSILAYGCAWVVYQLLR